MWWGERREASVSSPPCRFGWHTRGGRRGASASSPPFRLRWCGRGGRTEASASCPPCRKAPSLGSYVNKVPTLPHRIWPSSHLLSFLVLLLRALGTIPALLMFILPLYYSYSLVLKVSYGIYEGSCPASSKIFSVPCAFSHLAIVYGIDHVFL